MIGDISRIRSRKAGRVSSWDKSGRNNDCWGIEPGEACVLADIKGPGVITHIWMTQFNHYRDCLLRFTWDNAGAPSIVVPLGDFFCLGNNFVNSFQSLYFTASANNNNRMNTGCALNCYLPMHFRERALVELVNQAEDRHTQFFYIDYESFEEADPAQGYLHAEFRRANPFGGWGHEVRVNSPESNIVNAERGAWNNNYVILETKGRGHYIGCNLSVTNLQGNWWGEGDDMIWVDGYKWPPDLHGTGSEDYLNQAWAMQDNAFLRNGSSVWEGNTKLGLTEGQNHKGGYQSSYVFHHENPIGFEKEIKVTIEHGHGNHLRNEMSSVAYWYASTPCPTIEPPPVDKRQPILCDNTGAFLIDPAHQCPGPEIELNEEMKANKKKWAQRDC